MSHRRHLEPADPAAIFFGVRCDECGSHPPAASRTVECRAGGARVARGSRTRSDAQITLTSPWSSGTLELATPEQRALAKLLSPRCVHRCDREGSSRGGGGTDVPCDWDDETVVSAVARSPDDSPWISRRREMPGGRRRGDTWDVHDHQRGAGGFHIERVSPGETPGFQFDLDFHVIGDDGTLLKSGCMTLTQK